MVTQVSGRHISLWQQKLKVLAGLAVGWLFWLFSSLAWASPSDRHSGPSARPETESSLTWAERGPKPSISCGKLLEISSVSALEVFPLIGLAQSSFVLAQTPLVLLSQDLEDPLFNQLPLLEQLEIYGQRLADAQSHLAPLFLLDTTALPSLHRQLQDLKRLFTSAAEDFRRIRLSGVAQANYLMQQNTLLILRNLKHLLRAQVELIQQQRKMEPQEAPKRLFVLASYVDLLINEKLDPLRLDSLSGYHSILLMVFKELTDLRVQAEDWSEHRDGEWFLSLNHSLENSGDRLKYFQEAVERTSFNSMTLGTLDSASYLMINRNSSVALQETAEELRQLAQKFLMSP